ncbi:MAG: winged helix-turn-helix transcriptional regulator [Gemmatirosa sp.]|nr:winged helix-turn-helix transcriptional regulator [Gemmatirosa sp.]
MTNRPAPLGDAHIAPTAALLADPARAAMLLALSDGRALPAGALAHLARVGAPAASAHLGKLAAGGLVAAERHGRHRYYRLANPAVVAALEALAAVALPAPAESRREAHAAQGIRLARTCYDHLAGALGVGVTDALVAQGALVLADRAYEVTPAGVARLAALGVDLAGVQDDARRTRRPLTRACLDWSERRYHLAGALGAALVDRLLGAGWVERTPASRALRVTNAGRRALRREFALVLA